MKSLLFASSIQSREKDSGGGTNYGTCGFFLLLTITRAIISLQATDFVSFQVPLAVGFLTEDPGFFPSLCKLYAFTQIAQTPFAWLQVVLLSLGFDFQIHTVLFWNISQHGLSSWKLPKGVDLQGQQHKDGRD